MLAVFQHKVGLTDLSAVNAEQRQLLLSHAHAQKTRSKLLASQLAHFQPVLVEERHALRQTAMTTLCYGMKKAQLFSDNSQMQPHDASKGKAGCTYSLAIDELYDSTV